MVSMTDRVRLALIAGSIFRALAGCRYSFTGGSVPANLKTISIPIVQDQSGFGDPLFKDRFTEQLVLRFTNDGSLTLADRTNADSALETIITGVRESATVVKPGEDVSQRRITITARVSFTDLKLRKKLWEKDFSQWGDFPSGATLTQRDEEYRKQSEKSQKIF